MVRDTYAGSITTYRTRHERGSHGVSVRRAATAEEMVVLPGVAEPLVTFHELAAVAARLQHNKAHSTRRNMHPELSLLRAGFIVCGHCGWALAVSNPSPASQTLTPQYRCTAQRQHGPACPRPSITASMIDTAVWEQVAAVLRDPSVIAREVSRHRDDGGLPRELAAVETRLAGIAGKQTKIARAIASVDDAAAEPLYAELTTLAASKTAAQLERDALLGRIADQGRDVARVKSLTDWCARVAENLENLTYDEKRLALEALGVRVRAYRKGSRDEAGNPYPRWEMTMSPLSPDDGIVLSTTH